MYYVGQRRDLIQLCHENLPANDPWHSGDGQCTAPKAIEKVQKQQNKKNVTSYASEPRQEIIDLKH